MKTLNKIVSWVGLGATSSKSAADEAQAAILQRAVNTDSSEKPIASEENQIRIPECAISWLIEHSETSVRLSNAIKHSDFPFKTVSEYLLHPCPVEAVKKVQNIGRKTAYELDALIKDFAEHPQKYENRDFNVASSTVVVEDKNKALVIELGRIFSKYDFPGTLFNLPLSTRLDNALRSIADEERKFQTLYDCLSQYEAFKIYLLHRPNFGSKSQKELEGIIKSVCSHILVRGCISEDISQDILSYILGLQDIPSSEEDVLSFINALKAHTEPDNEETDKPSQDDGNLSFFRDGIEEINAEIIYGLIEGLLKDRELDVIKKRFGLQNKISNTLDEVAKDHGCTRERIRQIEKKGIRKLRVLKKAFFTYLVKEAPTIKGILFDSVDYFSSEEAGKNLKSLPGEYRLGIEIAYGDISSYLKTSCIEYKNYWLNTVDSDRLQKLKQLIDCDAAGKPLEKRIAEAIYNLNWPISLEALAVKIPEYNKESIESSLVQDFDAVIADGYIRVIRKNLRSSQRMVMVLKYAGRALSLSEVRAFHNQMFEQDVAEHLIGAVLGRLEEALIVERGKYNLYENLEFSSKEVDQIRQECFQYLNERKIYVSAKRIFDEIYLGRHSYNAEFNPYMLMGILQDDSRFVCKRGLMIGLSTFSEEDFVGLTEKICTIVDNHGPIDLKSIQEHLSADRKVLDVTVLTMLDDSAEHIKISPATYDRIDRVIGNKNDLAKLKHAIEIALIDGDLTIFSLQNRLEAVGVHIDKNVLASWLDKQENIERRKTFAHLFFPSEEIEEYNTKYKSLKDESSCFEGDQKSLFKQLKNEFPGIAPIDYRLTEKYPELVKAIDEGSELDNLLKEFDF